ELARKQVELYHNAPFRVVFIENKYGHTLPVQFKLTVKEQGFLLQFENEKKLVNFGTRIEYNDLVFSLTRNLAQDGSTIPFQEDTQYTCIIKPFDEVVSSYRTSMKIEAASKTSNVINITLVNNIPQKAKDFLDGLV
ncbi:hypothetical protein RZS08_22035, partial [Arthrospira platensis SPKY1]|nr:hypothetical protein [Arthrospira platensis SPKY1]